MQYLPFALVILGVSIASTPAAPSSKAEAARLNNQLNVVSAPELPARAAEAVKNAPPGSQNAVVQAVIQLVAEKRSASLIPVLASIASAAPQAAANAAALAAKALPSQAANLASAAAHAAPQFASQISQAVADQVPGAALAGIPGTPRNQLTGANNKNKEFKGNPPPKDPPPNRPVTNPGNGNGNRPEVPPGHVRDPKPGRDDQHHYGRP